ncbi:hypothetical protein [Streptomyces avidinii]
MRTGKALLAYFGSSYSLGAHTQTLPSKPDFAPVRRVLAMIVPSSSSAVCLKSDFGPVGMSTSGSPLGLAAVAGALGSALSAAGGGAFFPKLTASPLPENHSNFQAANPPPPSRSARATVALIHIRRRERRGGCG